MSMTFEFDSIEEQRPKIVRSISIPSKSVKGRSYIVEIYSSGDMDCQCVAHQMGKVCSHELKALAILEKTVARARKKHLLNKHEEK